MGHRQRAGEQRGALGQRSQLLGFWGGCHFGGAVACRSGSCLAPFSHAHGLLHGSDTR